MKIRGWFLDLELRRDSPEALEGWDVPCPVDGEEEQSGRALTDIMDIEVRRHGGRRSQVKWH